MHRTQVIVAWSVLLILPVVLSYVGFSYWIFRGKIQTVRKADTGY